MIVNLDIAVPYMKVMQANPYFPPILLELNSEVFRHFSANGCGNKCMIIGQSPQ